MMRPSPDAPPVAGIAGLTASGPGLLTLGRALGRDLERVEAARAAGIALWPTRDDGSKRPAPGMPAARRLPTLDEIMRALPVRFCGFSVRTGALGDDADPAVAALPPLEAGDLDDHAVADLVPAVAAAIGCGALVARLLHSYSDRTPAGRRLLYRTRAERGSEVLAQRLPAPAELLSDLRSGPVPLIETRSGGATAIVAPAAGPAHPTGAAYTRLAGGFDDLFALTDAEDAALRALWRAFDRLPTVIVPRAWWDGGLRPGDTFNRCVPWTEVLEPFGWRAGFELEGRTLWQADPAAGGLDAVTYPALGDRLRIVTTAPPFTQGEVLSKLEAYQRLCDGQGARV